MTHLTGQRLRKVAALQRALEQADASGCTDSEATEALHEVGIELMRKPAKQWGRWGQYWIAQLVGFHKAWMQVVHLILAPWEDETCPTCPKPRKR